ncbi:MAG: lysozyme [Gallionella sp.]|jgi:lysozyme
MNTQLAVEVACALARRWERIILTPYLCPAGVPTIGCGATYYENGHSVSLNDHPITRERAEQLLLWMVQTVYLPAVIKLCPSIDTPDRLAAIIDFTFNLGSGKLRISTLRKRINADCWEDVPFELMKWNKAGGRVLRGLTLRRAAEAALC